MVKTIGLQRTQRNTIKGSLLSFMRGEKSLNWVMGIIAENSLIRGDELQQIFNEIANYHLKSKDLTEVKLECIRRAFASESKNL